MSRKSIRPQSPRHILVYDQDWAFLQSIYGPSGVHPQVGVGPAIRELIHHHVARLRDAQRAAIDNGETNP